MKRSIRRAAEIFFTQPPNRTWGQFFLKEILNISSRRMTTVTTVYEKVTIFHEDSQNIIQLSKLL